MQTTISFDEDIALKEWLLAEEAREAVQEALKCNDVNEVAFYLEEIAREAYDRDPNHPRYDVDRFRFPYCTQEQVQQTRAMITPGTKIGAFLLEAD